MLSSHLAKLPVHFAMLEKACLRACDLKHLHATFEQVIYELTEGERQLIDDLSLVKKVLPTHHLDAALSELVPFLWVFISLPDVVTCAARCIMSPC